MRILTIIVCLVALSLATRADAAKRKTNTPDTIAENTSHRAISTELRSSKDYPGLEKFRWSSTIVPHKTGRATWEAVGVNGKAWAKAQGTINLGAGFRPASKRVFVGLVLSGVR